MTVVSDAEMLNQRFGRLVVQGRSRSIAGNCLWLCLCDSGTAASFGTETVSARAVEIEAGHVAPLFAAGAPLQSRGSKPVVLVARNTDAFRGNLQRAIGSECHG